MTRYAFEPANRTIFATWANESWIGDTASIVATAPRSCTGAQIEELTAELTQFSSSAWRVYAALQLSTSETETTQYYASVTKCANRVRGVLQRINSPALTEAVLADVAVEVGAVMAAMTGDLNGRAGQAVAFPTKAATDAQVAAADLLLQNDPLCLQALFSIEPTAAAIAAVRWLHAALLVAADAGGCTPSRVVMQAEDILTIQFTTLRTVVAMLADEHEPRHFVTSLVNDALEVAAGRISLSILEDICLNISLGGVLNVEGTVPLCLLDPSRPALNLLEDALIGIRVALVMYQEYSVDMSDVLDEDDRVAWNNTFDAAWSKAADEFLVAVRKRAASLAMPA
jgi:hypothetical protein